MPVKGYLARVKVSGTPVTMTAEPTTNTVTNLVYQITNVAKRVIPLDEPVVVKVGGTPVTTGFTVCKLNGKVTFDTNASRVVTIDSKYHPMSVAAEAKEFSVTINTELLDATKFASGGYVEKQAGLQSLEGSITEFYSIDRFFEDSLVAGSTVVVELYPDGTNPISAFVKITSSEIGASISELVEESISFESTNKALIAYI